MSILSKDRALPTAVNGPLVGCHGNNAPRRDIGQLMSAQCRSAATGGLRVGGVHGEGAPAALGDRDGRLSRTPVVALRRQSRIDSYRLWRNAIHAMGIGKAGAVCRTPRLHQPDRDHHYSPLSATHSHEHLSGGGKPRSRGQEPTRKGPGTDIANAKPTDISYFSATSQAYQMPR